MTDYPQLEVGIISIFRLANSGAFYFMASLKVKIYTRRVSLWSVKKRGDARREERGILCRGIDGPRVALAHKLRQDEWTDGQKVRRSSAPHWLL